MKTVVVYKSLTGFTKKYAEWIAQELKADLLVTKEIKLLLKYDVIIYGGSLHAVGISGINLIKNNLKKLKDKNLVIFTTGASPVKQSTITDVKNNNFSEEEQKQIKFYLFRGGFDFNKLSFKYKIIMTLFKWKIQLTKNKTPEEKGMLAAYLKPVDFTNKEKIKELLEYVYLLE